MLDAAHLDGYGVTSTFPSMARIAHWLAATSNVTRSVFSYSSGTTNLICRILRDIVGRPTQMLAVIGRDRGSPDPEHAIDRKPPSPSGDQIEQQSRPRQVGRPRVGVNENLDHGRHAEQRERRQAGEETQYE